MVAAINASAGANAKLVAVTYRGNAGAGVVLPRAKVNLSDFLTTATNGHVPRGPFRYSVMRIGSSATARGSASSSTASSTPASGPRR